MQALLLSLTTAIHNYANEKDDPSLKLFWQAKPREAKVSLSLTVISTDLYLIS